MTNAKSSTITRRRFLYGTALSAAVFQILPNTTVCGALSANDKVNVAGIGIGSQGGADLDGVVGEGHNIVALCDVDENYAAPRFKKHPNAKPFKDFRVMFDEMGKGIDAVVIGTPDHTHALIALTAMQHGKHVYCEKPLAHSIHEVRTLMAAAQKYKIVTQLGNQGHSSGDIRKICEWVGAGVIGKVETVHAACDAFPNVYTQLDKLDKLTKTYDVPKGLDYNLWLGPAPFRPYTPFWVHWNWRGWMPFGTGTIGDWICHVVDPTFWALDLDAPISVEAEVKDYDPAKHGLTYPPGSKITFEFPAKGDRGPVKLVWHDGKIRIPKPANMAADDKVPGTGAILFGDKGMITHGSHGGGGARLLPDALMEANSGKNAPPQKIPRVKRSHQGDWLDAIREGKPAGSNFGYGGPLTQVALIGAIAIRFPGQKLQWDDKAARFTNNELANVYVDPPTRFDWWKPIS